MTTIHGQRLRDRTIIHRLRNTTDSMSFVPGVLWLQIFRFMAGLGAARCYWLDKDFDVLLILLVLIIIQGMIISGRMCTQNAIAEASDDDSP